MAKGKYQKWLKDENLLLMQGWKRNGLTDEQIAHNMGISINTLNKWKRRFIQIRQALKIGREQSNFIVENASLLKYFGSKITGVISTTIASCLLKKENCLNIVLRMQKLIHNSKKPSLKKSRLYREYKITYLL